MTLCIKGPEQGRKCDEAPPGYQAFKIKLDPRDASMEPVKRDDMGCALIFVHSLTFNPENVGHVKAAAEVLRADATARRGPKGRTI